MCSKVKHNPNVSTYSRVNPYPTHKNPTPIIIAKLFPIIAIEYPGTKELIGM